MPTKDLNDLYQATVEADEAFDRTIRDLASKYRISQMDIRKLEDARQDSDRENYNYFYQLGRSQTLTERIKYYLKKMFK